MLNCAVIILSLYIKITNLLASRTVSHLCALFEYCEESYGISILKIIETLIKDDDPVTECLEEFGKPQKIY